jgi:hypothetical protein
MITKLIPFTIALFDICLHNNFESDWAPTLRDGIVCSYRRVGPLAASTHQAELVHVRENKEMGSIEEAASADVRKC